MSDSGNPQSKHEIMAADVEAALVAGRGGEHHYKADYSRQGELIGYEDPAAGEIPEDLAHFYRVERVGQERSGGEIGVTEHGLERKEDAWIDGPVVAMEEIEVHNVVSHGIGSYTTVHARLGYPKADPDHIIRSSLDIEHSPATGRPYVYRSDHADPEHVRDTISYVARQVVEAAVTDEGLAQLLEPDKDSAPTPEKERSLKGEWRKFDQDGDPGELAEALGQGIWVEANPDAAPWYLKAGDYYIWFSADDDGNYTVPLLTIRMQLGNVARVEPSAAQDFTPELIDELSDVAREKLEGLPDGKRYFDSLRNYYPIIKDVRHLNSLDDRLLMDPKAELSVEDVRFLYEIERQILWFGEGRDPRINKLRQRPNARADYRKLHEYLSGLSDEELAKTRGGKIFIGYAYPNIMRTMDLEEKISADSGAELSFDELRFLYGLDSNPDDYGYDINDKLKALQEQRDSMADYKAMYEVLVTIPEEDRGVLRGRQLVEAYDDILETHELITRIHGDPKADLSVEDLRFLYEIDRPVLSLSSHRVYGGHFNSDLARIIQKRDEIADYAKIFDCSREQARYLRDEMIDRRRLKRMGRQAG